MEDPGMFEEALKQVGYLKYIERSSFAKQVQLQLTGFFDVAKVGIFNKTLFRRFVKNINGSHYIDILKILLQDGI